MKKRTIKPSVGEKGQYSSIFSRGKRTWSSADYKDIETCLRENFPGKGPNMGKVIAGYENWALSIIDAAGYAIKRPYKFFDRYEHENGWALLPGIIERAIGNEKWMFTREGRAANVLVYCYQLRVSIKEGNSEAMVRNALWLQSEIDHLEFMPWDYPARRGEASIKGQRKATDKSANHRKGMGVKVDHQKIVAEFKSGVPTATIARRYDITQRNVQKIVKPHRGKKTNRT